VYWIISIANELPTRASVIKLHASVQMHEKKNILNKKHPAQGTGISV
jgi:hypothetical protein